jgi:hypothetical protein
MAAGIDVHSWHLGDIQATQRPCVTWPMGRVPPTAPLAIARAAARQSRLGRASFLCERPEAGGRAYGGVQISRTPERRSRTQIANNPPKRPHRNSHLSKPSRTLANGSCVRGCLDHTSRSHNRPSSVKRAFARRNRAPGYRRPQHRPLPNRSYD